MQDILYTHLSHNPTNTKNTLTCSYMKQPSFQTLLHGFSLINILTVREADNCPSPTQCTGTGRPRRTYDAKTFHGAHHTWMASTQKPPPYNQSKLFWHWMLPFCLSDFLKQFISPFHSHATLHLLKCSCCTTEYYTYIINSINHFYSICRINFHTINLKVTD